MNKSFLKLVIFGVVIFIFQILIDYFFPLAILNLKNVVKIHGFVFLITAIVITVTNRITNKSPDKSGFVYLGFVLFKMTLSVFFLYPYFSLELSQAKIIVSNFFIIFFLYIAFEATTIINYLNLKQNN